MATDLRDGLFNSLKSLFISGAYSDLTIVCGLDSYAVHKAILCQRSDYFAEVVAFGGKEAKESKITLEDDDPYTVKLMLQYVYEADYDPVESFDERNDEVITTERSLRPPHTCQPSLGIRRYCHRSLCRHHQCGLQCNYDCSGFICGVCSIPGNGLGANEHAEQLITHAKVYEIADKYNLVELKDLSERKFERACAYFYSDQAFAAAAHIVFTTTPNEDGGLRDIIVDTLSKHMELIKKPEVEALLKQYNGLTFQLLKLKSEQNGWR